jgi:hypothetical protein
MPPSRSSTRESEGEPLPVIQCSGEDPLDLLRDRLQVRHPRQDCRDSAHGGGDRVEQQLPKPRQDRQRDDHHGADDNTGANGCRDDGPRAVTAAFHDSSQPADIGAERDRPEAAKADHQEADHSGCDRRGDQNADPIAVGQQPHRHGAQQTQPTCVREDDRNDRDRRAQGAHYRCLSQFVGS